jgi:hypothetical protein
MGVYVLLFIVGSNTNTIERPRYESLNTCNVALANLLKQVYSKADVLTAQCTEK